MPEEHDTRTHPDRRDFLKSAGAAAAGALLLPHLEALAATPGTAQLASAATAGRAVQPFALTQVKLAESLFTQKRDRMLADRQQPISPRIRFASATTASF